MSFDFFFFNDTATTEIYTLSLHDALPILRGALPCAHAHRRAGGGARRTWSAQDRHSEGTHRSKRCRPFVPAVLLTGPQPYRGSVLEDKEHGQEGWGTHSRSVGRSHSHSDLGAHARRRGGMVRPLRLPPTGSMTMNTAVRTAPNTFIHRSA